MAANTLLKGACIVTGSGTSTGDILIRDGRFVSIGPEVSEVPGGTEVLDLSGLTVVPGFADIHVHFREPGFTAKETIRTGSAAAARGGYTVVCAMPNLDPVPDSPGPSSRPPSTAARSSPSSPTAPSPRAARALKRWISSP